MLELKPTSSSALWGKQWAMDCRKGGQETRVSGGRPETVRGTQRIWGTHHYQHLRDAGIGIFHPELHRETTEEGEAFVVCCIH